LKIASLADKKALELIQETRHATDSPFYRRLVAALVSMAKQPKLTNREIDSLLDTLEEFTNDRGRFDIMKPTARAAIRAWLKQVREKEVEL
jgi:DnaJ-domain-containing protein 1